MWSQAHPNLSDLERKKVCSVMDCQKLSREACAHAAQNDRLPVQTVVQVLYYEQQRLREAVNGSESPAPPHTVNVYTTSDSHPVPDELSTLKRENQDLKFELLKMKMKLKEIEQPAVDKSVAGSPSHSSLPSSGKPPLPRKSFISSVSKKLGRLYPFVRDGATPPKGRTRPPKDRRHSVS